MPGLRQLAGVAYDAFARNRTSISTFFGLAACGVPSSSGAARRPPETSRDPAPRVGARAQLPFVARGPRRGDVLVFAADVSVANVAVPQALRWEHRPAWMVAAVMYPHIFQSWSMFSPDAPLDRLDGLRRRRDARRAPRRSHQRGLAAASPTLPLDDIPKRLGHDSFWCDYTLRIPDAGVYHQALLEWLLRYPERTGNPNDTITGFDAYVVQHDSPRPGETAPRNFHKRVFLHYP